MNASRETDKVNNIVVVCMPRKPAWPSRSRFLRQPALGSKRVGRYAPFLVSIPISAEYGGCGGLTMAVVCRNVEQSHIYVKKKN